MKVFIIYDSKYGNTKIVAERILEGLKQVGKIEGTSSYAKEVTFISEAAETENIWMLFSMTMWVAWLTEKLGLPDPNIMLSWVSEHTPEGVYYKQTFVGK